MARSDLIKRVFASYKNGDDHAFREAALEIVEEERKKRHVVLANDLLKILNNIEKPVDNSSINLSRQFSPLPKDGDRGMPLVDIKFPARDIQSIILTENQLNSLGKVTKEFHQWDVLAAYGLKPSNHLLFFGPPGCGKTITAEAIANQLSIPMLYVRFDSVISSLLGETAANLRRIFEYAEREKWVLFFDEFDAIGRARSSEQDHIELKRVVNTFLQLLDNFSGQSIVIAATNHHIFLDPALWRRFDEIVPFNLPTKDQAGKLVSQLMQSWLDESLNANDLKLLSGMSHADIERACTNTKKEAIMDGVRKVALSALRKSIKKEKNRLQLITEELQNNYTL